MTRVRVEQRQSNGIKLSDEDQELITALQEAMRFDQNDLDGALMAQPELYWDVSQHLALLVSRRDAAKQNVAVVEAQVDFELRKAARLSDEKTTEKDIESRKLIHPDVREAVATHLKLQHAVGQFTAMKEAFQQRSYILKDLVALYIAKYYGDVPTRSVNNERMKNANADAAREAQRDERRRRDAR